MRKRSGFTIIELSVVIAIIAALAVLVGVGYGAWRSNLGQAAAKSDLTNFAASMENARVWSEGVLSGYTEFSDDTVFNGNGGTADIFTQSNSVTLTYQWGRTDMYCAEAVSSNSPGSTYYVNTVNGSTEVAAGTCPAEPAP